MNRGIVAVIVFVLLSIFVIQVLLSSSDKSPFTDEQVHTIRGLYFLKTGNLMVYGHPPMSHFLTVPFLAFENIRLPEGHNELYLKNELHDMAAKILYGEGNDAERIIFLARLPTLIAAVLLGVLIFLFAKELYGTTAGLFALFLYVFNPTVLSLSGMVMTDVIGALFIFLSVYAFWRMLREPSWINILLVGVAFGWAISTRLTAFLLIPVFVIIAISYYLEHRKNARVFPGKIIVGFIAMFLIGYVMLNAAYGFEGSFKSLNNNIVNDRAEYVDSQKYNSHTLSEKLLPEGVSRTVLRKGIEWIPIMVPYPFLKDVWSIPAVIYTAESSVFVLGKHANYIWYYLPVVFLAKTHLLSLLALALSIIAFRKIRNESITAELILILPFAIIFLFFIIFKHPEGMRYLMPVLPFLFVFVSKVTMLMHIKPIKIFLGILSVLYLIAAITIYPHYTAYFNEFAGGPNNGYKIAVGSNIDMGENMIRLKEYMDEKRNTNNKVKLRSSNKPGTLRNTIYSLSHLA